MKEKYLIKRFPSIPSTNSYCIDNVETLNDRTLVVAETQTSGRGRMQRTWMSDSEGSIYATLLLKPTVKAFDNSPIVNITQYMALCVLRTLCAYGVRAEIKWPNDVLLSGQKICGILSEASFKNNVFKAVALGFGVNIKTERSLLEKIDKPATSLHLHVKEDVDKEDFLLRLLDEFFSRYDLFLEKGFSLIYDDYVGSASFIGKEIVVKGPLGEVKGMALGIDSTGALLLDESGVEHRIIIGDVLCL